MAEFAVSPEKNRWLKARMAELGVKAEDLEERFVHSSGSGGQHVNKSASCVYLKHLPTGAEVKCMESRSQSLNRFLARRLLLEKIEAAAGGQTRKERAQEKLKKQKSRRKRRGGAKYPGEAGSASEKAAARELAGAGGATLPEPPSTRRTTTD